MNLVSHIRNIGPALIVGVVVALLLSGTAYAVVSRTGGSSATLSSAAASSPLRLSASSNSIAPGKTVTLTVRTNTSHARTVRLERWDASRKAWRQVVTGTVKSKKSVKLTPSEATNRYRARTAKLKHRTGGKTHTHKAATSATVWVKVQSPTTTPTTTPTTVGTTAPTTAPSPEPEFKLTDAEAALFAGVAYARNNFVPTTHKLDSADADACLTKYAREHSAWMSSHGKAADPGSAAHAAADRPLPTAECSGLTINAVTRAVGAEVDDASAVAHTVHAWLSSPYGEPDRLLSICQSAPKFEFGIGVTEKRSVRWVTVLIASSQADTKSTGVC